MRSRLWCRRLLVLSLELITIVSVIPHGSAATLTVPVVSVNLDKILHFLGFACLLLLAFAASKHLGFWKGVRVAAYVMIYGVVIEFAQYYIPYRTFNPVDIFANLCGVGVGIGAFKLVKGRFSGIRSRCGEKMSDHGPRTTDY